MKKIIFTSLFASLLLLGACQEKEPTATPQPRSGTLNIKMNHQVNGKALVKDDFQYMTEAGDSFQVTLLQYYLSNFEFHSPETGWQKKEHYQLVRADAAETFEFDIKELPFGNYDSVRFALGIDSAANHDISKLGQLDPGYGMIWTWNSGYIFYMFEGKFVDSLNRIVPFAYHIGGDNYLTWYSLPIQQIKGLTSSNATASLSITLEMDEFFKSPNLIELNKVAKVSHTFDEPQLSQQLIQNLNDAFTAE
ncbi:MAG: hypothetical protein LPK45_10750 [Bacteroidota bacterium]|nr:hypothetical protein [Bacteroidota bacterium]MDX5431579.1 hypothetical protein [Bacteroidota bacterium]MDX5470299.1 hypothetical protein [Bacteroidota bacterium]